MVSSNLLTGSSAAQTQWGERDRPRGGAVTLPQGPATGMALGADIPALHPAIIATVRIGAEVVRGVHLARTATRRGPQRWRCGREGVGVRLSHVLAGGTMRLV